SFLGLDAEVALDAVFRRGLGQSELDRLRGRTIASLETGTPGVTPLLPAGAEGFFYAEQVVAGGVEVEIEPGFAVLVANEGSGTLSARNGPEVEVSAGETFLLPAALDGTRLRGPLSGVRCTA